MYYAETILCAAILHGGLIHSVPRPERHHHVIQRMKENGLGPHAMLEQGFLTSTGRFVDRYEGMIIAKNSGAFLGKNTPEREDLFSEDLW